LERHNEKSANFETELRAAQTSLEEELARRGLADYDYFGSFADAEKLVGVVNGYGTAIQKRKYEMDSIEESLSNEGLGAASFNDSLHRFLGRSELSLVFNARAGGYEINRSGIAGHDRNLSEGEKTAIAFVYFITKISENDNELKRTIVVVDDPVSSFDSNHLFHAYSYLRNRLGEAKQLFVFTHNFTFFRMVRDWLAGINRNRMSRSNPQPPSAFFYTVESGGSPRTSVIRDAGQSLVDYSSEYHFIYGRLAAFRDLDVLDRDQAFIAANLARKLLEAFFAFKFPQHRSDLSALLERGQSKCTQTTPEVREKVYRFVNRYSHGAGIDVDEDATENMIAEGGHVVRDIFVWMGEVDPDHVEQMELVCAEDANASH
jgi:wobble nucleotide-excising tRNase